MTNIINLTEIEQKVKELENKPINELLDFIKTKLKSNQIFTRDTRVTIYAIELLINRHRKTLKEINRCVTKYYWNTDSEV